MRFELHEAKPGDWSVLRTMLGDRMRSRPRQRRPMAWLAWKFLTGKGAGQNSGSAPSIAGAAVLWKRRNTGRVWVQVVRPYRRQGLGRQLFEHLFEQASSFGVRQLISQQRIDASGEGARLLESCGFRPVGRLTRFQSRLSDVIALLDPLHQRLQSRGRVPPAAELLCLDQAEKRDLLGQVAALVNQHLGGKHRIVVARMRGNNSQPLDREGSMVLVHRDRVVAIGLSSFLDEQQGWLAEATVVAPDCRGGWANGWLKYCWVKRMLELRGIDSVQYDVEDQQQDTRRLAQKIDAVAKGATCAFIRKLDVPEPAIMPRHD